MKKYLQTNVFDASIQRLHFIFNNFDRIYLSFSGGKDSGVMLNLTLDFMRKHKITKKLGIMIMDNEANYEDSLSFMQSILDSNLDLLDVYWCCLPITLPCTVSAYNTEWQCWGEKDKDKWIRPLPKMPYVVSYSNHNFDFFTENMSYDKFWDMFGDWYSEGKRTACLIGIRADESLNRYRAIVNERKETLLGEPWTKKNTNLVYNCYPIYDWGTKDIWVANAKFGWNYNKLYDKFYMAGLSIHSMRVASPFMSESKSSLNMYRVIDPNSWARLCMRVNGANFIATYGKQINYTSFKLPPQHTWKSFTKFLLNTLPKEVAQSFTRKFIQSLKFWRKTGRGLPDNIIRELISLGHIIETNGETPYGRKTKKRVIFKKTPDHLDELSSCNSDALSWKRFALTILKNDHHCKYLGLGQTQGFLQRQRELMEKYRNL